MLNILCNSILCTSFFHPLTTESEQGDDDKSKEWEGVLPLGRTCTNPQLPEDWADREASAAHWLPSRGNWLSLGDQCSCHLESQWWGDDERSRIQGHLAMYKCIRYLNCSEFILENPKSGTWIQTNLVPSKSWSVMYPHLADLHAWYPNHPAAGTDSNLYGLYVYL